MPKSPSKSTQRNKPASEARSRAADSLKDKLLRAINNRLGHGSVSLEEALEVLDEVRDELS